MVRSYIVFDDTVVREPGLRLKDKVSVGHIIVHCLMKGVTVKYEMVHDDIVDEVTGEIIEISVSKPFFTPILLDVETVKRFYYPYLYE